MKGEKILIISYLFPPSAGIGGRRWAKIAKHWDKQGNDVEVIASYNPNDSKGPWDADIAELASKGKIHYTKIHYPDILNSFEKKSLIKELQYRLSLIWVRSLSKGNYYDRSIIWSSVVSKLIRSKIEAGFTNIVASGAPFYYLKAMLELKKEFPDIKVWVDLRDPWSWGKGYGMAALNEKRLSFEKELESYVLKNADLLTVPVRSMLDHLQKEYPSSKQVKLIPHFFDPDDLPDSSIDKDSSVKKWIYAGTVYEGTQSLIKAIADHLLDRRNEGEKIVWDLYVPETKGLKALLKEHIDKGIVNVNAYIPVKDVLRRIEMSDLYIAVYPPQFKDHLSTKFPEIYALNTPMIYVGEYGQISSFIDENSMGSTILPKDLKNEFHKFHESMPERQQRDKTRYSVGAILGDSFSENLI